MPKRRKSQKKTNWQAVNDQANMHDQLVEFEEFQNTIAPMLRKDMKKLNENELLTKYGKYALARMITIAMTSKSDSKALSAARDIADRTFGKAVERKAVAHRFEGLPDNELDAILQSELKTISSGNDEE